MSGETKISGWRVAVVLGAMLLFVLGTPSLPGKHHLIYWATAFVVEAAICATLRPFERNSN